MPKVVALWRYPVKSTRGESLETAEIDADGVRGDRAWACVDEADATIGSAKHPRRWGRLLDVHVRSDGPAPTLLIEGDAVRAGTAAADARLSAYLGRPVRLTSSVPDAPQSHRVMPDDDGMIPEWMGHTRPGQELITNTGGHGRFVDFAPVHLLTTGALARLASLTGREIPPARFRPNLLLDAPADPSPGEEVVIGEVVLRIAMPTPRCVIPSLPQGGLPDDRALLKTLASEYRRPVAGLGRAACFGVYAEVVRPGFVTAGG